MPYLSRISAFTILIVALMSTSTTWANAELEAWEKRIPGRSSLYVTFAPTHDLHEHCPNFVGPLEERGVRGGFTPECEARLNEQFFDYIPPHMPFEAKDNRITWRYVFDRPLAKRRLVLDALSKPECVSVPEDADTDDLAERCHVNAIADFATLKYKCASDFYRLRGRIEEGIELPWYYVFPLERVFNNESYWRKRWGIENGYFRHAWIAAKCEGLPNDALASLGVFENTADVGGEPAPGEEGWWWAEQGFEAAQLMDIAARLSPNLTRTKYGYENESISNWQFVQPVMAELLEVKNPGDFSNDNEEKAARLKHFIAAQTWIEKRRVDVSEDWLLEQIGDYSDAELTQATEEATAMMNKQEVGTNWH